MFHLYNLRGSTTLDLYGGFFVTDFDEMCDILTHALIERGQHRSLTVAVLASARADFTRKHILPHVQYWNCRSKDRVDFFFLGYQGEAQDGEYSTVNNDPDRGFDEATFVESLERFEKHGWTYEGRPSALLFESVLKVRKSDGARKAFPNLSEYIDVPLENAIGDGVIESVETFFEQIIRFAASTVAPNPQWRLSDVLVARSVGKALVDIVFENLPIKGLDRAVKAAQYFRLKTAGA